MKANVIRAWKDSEYRNSLSQAERGALPANPAGSIEISDAELGKVSGGMPPRTMDCTHDHYCITYLFYCYTNLIC